jgi:hypothetical protein
MPASGTPPTAPNLTVITHAVTIRLPWAAATRAGRKTTENRGRPVPDRDLGTTVAVHAGATWSRDGARDGRIQQWWWGPNSDLYAELSAPDFSNYFRNVIAVATIAGQHEANQAHPYDTCCWPWGDRTYRRPDQPAIHIEWANIVPIEPVGPIAGNLSVPWKLTPGDAEAVTGRYHEAISQS